MVKPLMRRLREIAARHACTIIPVCDTAKGQIDGNNVSERGMRGSGAWTNNARFGFGLWRPDNESAASILKRLELPVIQLQPRARRVWSSDEIKRTALPDRN